MSKITTAGSANVQDHYCGGANVQDHYWVGCQCSRSLLLVVVVSLTSLLSSKSLVRHTGGWLSEKKSMD